MARPMLLIKKPLLHKLCMLWRDGVPVLKLIDRNKLPITPPTLTKLLRNYSSYLDMEDGNELKPVIFASLFPSWVTKSKTDIVKQDDKQKYRGLFPIGKWLPNDWTEKNAR